MLLFDAFTSKDYKGNLPYSIFALNIKPYYMESHRHWHTLTHVERGIGVARRISYEDEQFNLSLAQQLAWLAQGIVYLPFEHINNEDASSKLLEALVYQHAKQNKAEGAALFKVLDEAQAIILCTKDHNALIHSAQAVMDLDLEVFRSTHLLSVADIMIEKEYSHVEDFQLKRAYYLNSLVMSRSFIYSTQYALANWEKKAQQNIKLRYTSRIEAIEVR